MAILIHSPEMPFGSKIFFNPNPSFGKLSTQPFTNRKVVGSNGGIRVSCRVKDFEVSNLDLNVTLRSYGQFSAPVKQGSRPSKEEEEKQDYYLNMGYAIRNLREEFPELFYRELSFNIYRFRFDCLHSWLCMINNFVIVWLVVWDFVENPGVLLNCYVAIIMVRSTKMLNLLFLSFQYCNQFVSGGIGVSRFVAGLRHEELEIFSICFLWDLD